MTPDSMAADHTAAEAAAAGQRLPDLPVYLSRWRAAACVALGLPFLLAGLAGTVVIASGIRPFPGIATAALFLFCAAMGLYPVLVPFLYGRRRGPMYVFTADGLIIGGLTIGGRRPPRPIPWQDVWFTTRHTAGGPLGTVILYREPASTPGSLQGFDWRRRLDERTTGLVRGTFRPNVTTLGNWKLQSLSRDYARAAGADLGRLP